MLTAICSSDSSFRMLAPPLARRATGTLASARHAKAKGATIRADLIHVALHAYNNHRGHTALKGQPRASRVTNLSGQNRLATRWISLA
jgi:hypothetical protein